MRAEPPGVIVTLATVQSPQQLKVSGTSVGSQLFKGYLLPTTQAKTPYPHVESQTHTQLGEISVERKHKPIFPPFSFSTLASKYFSGSQLKKS